MDGGFFQNESTFFRPPQITRKNTCGQFIWCSVVFPNIFGVTEGLWYQKPDVIGFQMFHRKNINKRDKGYIISCKFNFCSYIHEIFMEMMFKNSFLTTPIVIIVYNHSIWTNSSIYAIPLNVCDVLHRIPSVVLAVLCLKRSTFIQGPTNYVNHFF